jgi:hypothetical protein
MSLDETIEIMEIVDRIRHQTGIEFSGVKPVGQVSR